MNNRPATRIGIFLPSLAGGGAERAYLDLASCFVAWGIRVDLVLAWAEGPYLPQVHPNIRIFDLRVTSKIQIVWSLARYLRHERPDVLFSALDVANIVALVAQRLSRSHVPVFVSTHTHLSRQARYGGRLHDRVLPSLARLLYPGADGIIAVSQGVGRDLVAITRLPKDRIKVIPNPVAVNRVRALAAEPVEHPWLHLNDVAVLLSVGRLSPEKDYPTLFRAVAKVRRSRAVRLIVLGEGPDRVSLEKMAGELGISDILSMPGFVRNPYAYMARARLFVLSSRWEGFGLVIAEAMACGCPVVSTDCPSGPTEILAGGQFGRLTPVGDVDALASAIEETLDSTTGRERLVARARSYDVDHIARAYLGIFGIDPSMSERQEIKN